MRLPINGAAGPKERVPAMDDRVVFVDAILELAALIRREPEVKEDD